ncbi:MAG: DUF3604 domain-containing protein [Pseudomonadales bacterium]
MPTLLGYTQHVKHAFHMLLPTLLIAFWGPTTFAAEAPRSAYFGDLHVHTTYSFDAFIFGTRAGPDDAYRFAKGETLTHPAGIPMALKKPLDFLAVTDHATYLGMFPEMFDAESRVGQHPLSSALREAATPADRNKVFQQIIPRERGYIDFEDDLLDLDVVRSAWQEIIAAAQRHNDPGSFTTFIGYEFTAGGQRGQNLHRNVIFEGATVPQIPFSRLDAENNPEKLWAWMDELRTDGIESLAIPHNSNGSDGWMFETTTRAGTPIDIDYAEQRLRNEPLVEVTQVKGTSDTHPLLSPNDEWADFEIMNYTIGTSFLSQPQGGYVRDAYRRGLQLAENLGANPYKFGLIGSSDTHNVAGSFREDDYWSKTGMLDASPELRGSVPQAATGEYAEPAPVRRFWGASGLAGVWAEANTRKAIYAAFRRKETFATTGSRIKLRFFGGFGLADKLADAKHEVSEAYAAGVTMGGELTATGQSDAPDFLVWAIRDSLAAPLERVQIVKGWIADGETQERIYDVACETGEPDKVLHRCPPSGAGVDLATCAVNPGGAAELKALWQDPDFDPEQRAFYYVRVLERPTCRWSTWDAIRSGHKPRPDLHATIQERAWSSPIWYAP